MSLMKRIEILFISVLLCFAWVPFKQVHAEDLDTSKLYSQFIFLMDGDTGQTLYSKDGDASIYPASMTKMMTALLAIEHYDNYEEEKILITNDTYRDLTGSGASLAGFSVGDHPTVLDLLYGTLIPSGAEAAQALAIGVAGSIDNFVVMMNQKAIEIGMTKTHFTNPTGLHNDDQYSTCHDMAILLNYCRQYELFTTITTTYTYDTIPIISHPRGLHMEKHLIDRMFEEIPNFEGGKSGYTHSAGRCLASSANIDGIHYILVTAKSRMDIGAQTDAIQIYQWARNTFYKEKILTKGEVFGTIEIKDAQEEHQLTVLSEEEIEVLIKPLDTYDREINLVKELQAPVEKDTELGTVRIIDQDDNVLFEKTYYLDHHIEENNRLKLEKFLRENPLLIVFYGMFLLILFLFLIMFTRAHSKR